MGAAGIARGGVGADLLIPCLALSCLEVAGAESACASVVSRRVGFAGTGRCGHDDWRPETPIRGSFATGGHRYWQS